MRPSAPEARDSDARRSQQRWDGSFGDPQVGGGPVGGVLGGVLGSLLAGGTGLLGGVF